MADELNTGSNASDERVLVSAWKFWVEVGRSWRPLWVMEAFRSGEIFHPDGDVSGLMVKTPEGDTRVEVGDWIIRGDEGGLQVCKPDVFEATYEAKDE